VRLAVIASLFLALAAPARADRIHISAGFAFELPDLGAPWELEDNGVYATASWGERTPELRLFLFAASHDDSLDHAQRELASELETIGAELDGKPTPFTVLSAKPEKIADAQAIVGEIDWGGTKLAYALVQRDKRIAILIAAPRDGIYERGRSNFRATLRALEPTPAGAISRDVLPSLPPLAAVREVTATSTYADKRGMYAPWRTLVYDQTNDATGTIVPTTAWCEGKPDAGIGETLTIRLARPTPISRIRIAAGVWLTPQLFDSNNHITALEVALDGKTVKVAPPGKREWTAVAVGAPVSTIAIRIAAVDRGKMNDSCLSAIVLERDGEVVVPVRGIDGAALDELPRALAKLLHDHPVKRVPKDDHPLSIRPGDPATIVVESPGEHTTRWNMQWKAGAWHLLSVDR